MSPIKVGDIRASQVLYTYGVGSLVNLPQLSVLVMGLEEWDTSSCREITEERLLAAAQRRLGAQVRQFYHPPVSQSGEGEGQATAAAVAGVPVAPFPRWARCPFCDLLAPLDQNLFQRRVDLRRPERTRYVHVACSKVNEPTVVPVRFMLACKNGHLEDFPWMQYVHRDKTPCKPALLHLTEFGVSGDPSDIRVSCASCGAKRQMVEVFGLAAARNIPPCRGSHPHLRSFPETACEEPHRVIILGASNSWFPVALSAIALPSSGDALAQIVREQWSTLEKATSMEVLKALRALNLLPSLAGYTDKQVWQAIEAKRNAPVVQADQAPIDLKVPEWEILSRAGAHTSGSDFRTSEVSPPLGYERFFSKTVLVERLREVRILLGFTRIESPGDFSDGIDAGAPRRAPLSRRSPEWLPAAEVRGEGLFLQFNEDRLRAWCAEQEIRDQSAEFLEGHSRWRRIRGMQPESDGFPGMRYVLLHSFAHALMRQVSLECGYSASSIRERIYARDPDVPGGPMAGVLIYTGAPDSEGTLGGLVSLGRPDILSRILEQAFEQMRLCASDPLCAARRPAEAVHRASGPGQGDEYTIHGAACHACLFSPETACEKGNKYLDRGVLVQVFGSAIRGFFERGGP